MVVLVSIPHPFHEYEIVYTFPADVLWLLSYGFILGFLLVVIGRECPLLLRKRFSTPKVNP